MTRSGVMMKSTGTSWPVSGIAPAARTWSSWTVLTHTVWSDQARRGGQREFQVGEPAALTQPCTVLPGRNAAHHHQVNRR